MVPVHRIADCRGDTVAGRVAQEVKLDGVAAVGAVGEGRGGDHFRSTKRTRTLRGYVSSVDSLIVRIVHAGLSDARSSGGRKRRARALLSLRRAVFFRSVKKNDRMLKM